MSNFFSNSINSYFTIILIFIIIICIFFIPFISNIPTENYNLNSYQNSQIIISSNNLYWPLPGYTRISSYFGNRPSPTPGATTFHGGIDIPAPAGTNIISVISGKVTRIRFYGQWWV